MTVNGEPSPFLRVTSGSFVFSSDGEKLGKVKDIGAGFLKVQTPLLQRDYWLAAELVRAALPGDSVTLGVDKANLDGHKLYKDPQRAA
jgi:hypothetical protein